METTSIYYEMFRDYPDVVKINQMCQMLNIGKNKAYDMLQQKVIPSRRVGTPYRIAKQDIIAYLVGNKCAE